MSTCALALGACSSGASTGDVLPGEDVAGNATFTIDVWADNWFALYVNGTLVGEDSVPTTTERSFNKETFVFDAEYPLTIALEAKDFKEDDSGLEYIGSDRQQMGDGGIIAQVYDNTTGQLVAATTSAWSVLVVHRAPLNKGCESSSAPLDDCQTEIVDTPDGWTATEFDDAAWGHATEWSEGDVEPKDGYDEVAWDPAAKLIWGTDLETDNTVLLRFTTR